MRKITTSNGFEFIVDDNDYEFVSKWRWKFSEKSYIHRCTSKNRKNICIKLHRLLCDAPEDKEVDHIDGNIFNLSRSNLRVCTRFQNAQNRGISKNSATGVKGVWFRESENKYQSAIQHNGFVVQLGRFETKEEASRAYSEASKKFHKEYSRTG